MHTARPQQIPMLHLSVIKPLLGAIGWWTLAALYTGGVWQWLADNNRSLAGAAAAINILWGAYRAGVWLRRHQQRRRHAQTHLVETPRKRFWK